MFAGGVGDQTGIVVPGIIKKTNWIADANASTYMDANGLGLYEVSWTDPYGIPTVSGTELHLAGDYSNAVAGMYAYMDFVVPAEDVNSGYFEIIDANSSYLTTSYTNLKGATVADSVNGLEKLFIGGAGNNSVSGTVIKTANDRIASSISLAGNNVDVLYNISETVSGDIDMDTPSDLLGKIRYLGTTHTGRGDTITEFQACADESQYPVIDIGDYYFKTDSSAFLEFENIAFTTINTATKVSLDKGSVAYKCAFYNTNTSAYASQAVQVRGGSCLLNCHVTTAGGANESAYGAITNDHSFVIGCFVEADVGSGLYSPGNYNSAQFRNNIVVGGASNVNGVGITVASFTNEGYADISNNTVVGFSKGLYIGSLPIISEKQVLIFNNIFWGTNAAGSIGLDNGTTGSKETTVFLRNNFVGNFLTESTFAYSNAKTVALTVCPFINANGDYSEPSDFYLTAAAKSICRAIPTRFGLGSADDNFQSAGAIMAEPSGSGTTTATGGSIIVTMD